MVERASKETRVTADCAIGELLTDGQVLTLMDIREIYRDFNISPIPASVELVRRVKLGRFYAETRVRAAVRRYLNMDVLFNWDGSDINSVAATRYQIEDHRAKRSARRKEARELLKV